MFRSLRNKLVLLYTVSTGFILVLVMIFLLFNSEKDLEAKRMEAYRNHEYAITNTLQFENSVKHSWLSQLELEHNLIIHIEDNGNPLKFSGVLTVPTDRELLLRKLSTLALKEGIDIGSNPVYFHTAKSNVFIIKGNQRDIYYGSAVVIPTDNGWRSFLLLQYLPKYHTAIRNQWILFSLLGIAGLLALFLVSLCFVSRMLKPMEENNRRQTEFIASASHELRSPLSVIRANLAAIPDTSPEAQKFLNGMDKECRRMARLIEDMLLLASLDTKSWKINKEPVETDTLLIETYEAYYPMFHQKERMLSLELPEQELPAIHGDKERLQQILAVLMDNALTYTSAGQSVALRGAVSDSYVSLEVVDHGIGISDEDKKYIFDRFYRADRSRNDKQHFGLGLSIAKELVQLQGGKITVKNTDGGGTTFTLRFKI